jgi:formylglycine-generating enzyme required for sulfatase activity
MKLIPKGIFYRARVENPDSSYSWSEAQEGFYTTIPNDFWLDSTEVTQKQFEDLLGVNPSNYKDSSSWPVHNISYNDAVYYCNERSKAIGLDTMATWTAKSGTIGTDLTFTDLKIDTLSYGYRIVGHEEFEYALRAGTTTDWFWGEKLSDIGDYAVWSGNANKKVFTAKPVSVASKLPNAWGLYDMIGNVKEVTLNPKFNYSKGGFTRGNSYMDQLNTGFMAATTNGLSGQDIETGFRCALRTSN